MRSTEEIINNIVSAALELLNYDQFLTALQEDTLKDIDRELRAMISYVESGGRGE